MRGWIMVLCLLLAAVAQAGNVTVSEAVRVAENTLAVKAIQGEWDGATAPSATLIRTLNWEGEPTAYYFEVEPTGCLLVSAYREMPPLRAYSSTSRLTYDTPESAGTMFAEMLAQKAKWLELNPSHPELAERFADQWTAYTAPTLDQCLALLNANQLDEYTPGTVLLPSIWHQEAPYNNFCPIEDTENCKVGCVATATAQIMYYWRWPLAGTGSHSYSWNSQVITANFSDPYDWDNILPEYGQPWQHTTAELNAVAELNFEVGVAYEMNYGVDGSGAYTDDAIDILPQYFNYLDTIYELNRADYPDDQAWFDILCTEIDEERPILYTIRNADWGHAIVIDGWRIDNQVNEIHVNYGGWVDIFLGWYGMDGIPFADWPTSESAYLGIEPDGDTPPPPPVAVTLTPSEYPIIFVNQGEAFSYDVTLSTSLTQPQYGFVWAETLLPNGSWYGPVYRARMLFVPGMAITVQDVAQLVPSDAPLGYYQWWVHVGPNTNTPLSSDFFAFTVLSGSADGATEWASSGHERLSDAQSSESLLFAETSGQHVAIPDQFTVNDVYPNPFNATATIRFSLPLASTVQVSVYNTLGQRVHLLANEHYQPGAHHLTLDASTWSSGIYFVETCVAGQQRDLQKIVLIR